MTVLKEAGTLAKTTAGRFKIGVITPGTGSSGTYPRETIEAAGRDKVFPAGTHMYLDHYTEAQDFNRPEGSIRDLVGVLTEDASWDDETGGLVAEARIYSKWKSILEEMKDDIGISIRASGEVKEDAGQRIVTRLTEARSVDFVTKAGRGGRIIEVLESARAREVQEGLTEETRALLRRAVGEVHPDSWLHIRDHNDTTVWYDVEAERGDVTYEQTYSRDGVTVTLTGTPTEVFPTTVYVPTNTTSAPAEEDITQKEEAAMADAPTDASRVEEADTDLAKENTALKAEITTLKAEIKALKAKEAKEARHNHVSGIVAEAFENLDTPGMKNMLIEKLAESDLDDDKLAESAKEAADELHRFNGGTGSVQGLGESAPADQVQESDTPKRTAEDTIRVLEGA